MFTLGVLYNLSKKPLLFCTESYFNHIRLLQDSYSTSNILGNLLLLVVLWASVAARRRQSAALDLCFEMTGAVSSSNNATEILPISVSPSAASLH